MDKIKKIILMRIPMSICNFRCHYCYLSQRDESFQGVQPEMKYSPQEVAKALSRERIGGSAYFNFCADGETLLTKDIDKYIKAIVDEGHYVEIVTNLTITSVLNKILSWDKTSLEHIEFKCSFHYLELKKRNLLEEFARNVNRIWEAGASANIEITPSDELLPYINEVKEFSWKYFKALPHLTIARDDRTKGIDYLTKLSIKEYESVWSQFASEFWQYKRTIFGKKQTDFCYAGMWSLYIDLTSGKARQCYCGKEYEDVFKNPEEPLPSEPIGKCKIAHCYNGHALLTLGLIPNQTNVKYGNIRNREMSDGTQWLQRDLLDFFNTKCIESNDELSQIEKNKYIIKSVYDDIVAFPFRALRKLKRKMRNRIL